MIDLCPRQGKRMRQQMKNRNNIQYSKWNLNNETRSRLTLKAKKPQMWEAFQRLQNFSTGVATSWGGVIKSQGALESPGLPVKMQISMLHCQRLQVGESEMCQESTFE